MGAWTCVAVITQYEADIPVVEIGKIFDQPFDRYSLDIAAVSIAGCSLIGRIEVD
jgi:hypothetical protein